MKQETDPRVVLLVATLASFITPYIGSATNIALPLIGTEFSAGAVTLGWVSTTYLLTSAVFLIPFGRLADIKGLRPVFVWGLGLFSLGALLTGLAISMEMLLICIMIMGIGGAMIYATAVAMLTRAFPPEVRGRVLGINVAAVYIGLSAGPFLGGILSELLGWRSVYFVMVPAGIATILLTILKISDDWKGEEEGSFDLRGSLIYAFMLFALIYGLSKVPSRESMAFILASVLALGIFIWTEKRTEAPVLNIDLFSGNRTFALSNLSALISYSSTAAIAFLMSLYLQYNRGFNPMAAGTILVSQALVQAAVSPAAGKLSDRIEPRIIASAGMALTALGLFLLSGLTEETPITSIVLILALLGLGFGLFSSPNTNAIMTSVPGNQSGVAAGTMSTMRVVGQMLSMGIAMMLFSVIIGHVTISPDVHTGLLTSAKTAFTIFGILCLGGIACSLSRGRIRGWQRQ